MSVAALQQLESIWAAGLGRSDVRIALLDGPVDLTHPCFAGADLQEIDVLGRSATPSAAALRHGTQVASIIFAQHHGSELRGIAPGCTGLLIPLYQRHGEELRCTHVDLARAINAAVDADADVINISGGELWNQEPLAAELVQAVVNAAQRGALIVAAAGNDGCQGCIHVPAALPGVVAVGAANRAGDLDPRSNHGGSYSRNGIMAPGVGVLTAIPGGGYAPASGTSFAAPYVAGIAGLMASSAWRPQQRVDLQLVREIIFTSSDPAEARSAEQRGLVGRINPSRAFEFMQHRLIQPLEEPAMSSTAEVTLSPSEVSYESPGLSTEGIVPASSEGVEPTGCGCGGNSKSPQYVYAIGQLSVDFLHETRKLSLFEHDETNQALGPPFGRVTETIGGLLRYLLGVDVRGLMASLGCERPGGDKESPPASSGDDDDVTASLCRLNVDDASRLCCLLQKKAFNGHFYDAESIQWVLRQDECPLYVIKPSGAFAREAYQQLLIFFIEQLFMSLPQFRCEFIKDRCLTSFYPCHGGTQGSFLDCLESPSCDGGGSKPNRSPKASKNGGDCGCDDDVPDDGDDACNDNCNDDCNSSCDDTDTVYNSGFDVLGEGLSCASRIAIAGEIVGKTRLYSGEIVPVVVPTLRGCANWNSRALLNSLQCGTDEVRAAILRTLATLYEHARNPGLSECDRAANYWVTQIFDSLRTLLYNKYFLSLFGIVSAKPQEDPEILKIVPGDLTCRPAACNPVGARVMDVELSFYKFDNMYGGDAVISQPIDVADVVPVLRGKYRMFQRRNR